jgi:phage shock protein PspC (stress-responsive transcriptional regulator)
LHRSFTDSKLFGVCGGLGEYFGIDSTIVRILFLVGAFASGGVVVIGYIIMAIAVPKGLPLDESSLRPTAPV